MKSFKIFLIIFFVAILTVSMPLSSRAVEEGVPSVRAQATELTFNEGDAVSVEWNGKWYPAHVLEVNAAKNSFKIHYDGYSASWDEWVGASRIKK